MNKKLHIVSVHGFYQWTGGEDSVFRAEKKLLSDHGHTITSWEKSNKELLDHNSLIALSKTIWNHDSYRKFKALLCKTKPDIVHCHNTFGIISPSIYYAASSLNIPVVQTLHNYRYCCLNATLFRDGVVCEKCTGKSLAWPGVAHRCYHEQLAPSLGMFATQTLHRAAGTWKKHINAYIALTDSARQRFIKAGLPPDKIFVKPNFVFDMGERKTAGKDYVLFVGRLSEEKGVRLLADAWQNLSGIPLKIAGTGPLKSVLENVNGVELLDWVKPDSLRKLVKGAKFVIVPSLCYEQFPMAVAESFCCGVPVLASNHGAMADLVEDGVTGRLFEPGSAASLAAVTTEMWNDNKLCIHIGKNARKKYMSSFSPDENYKHLMHIYNTTILNYKNVNF